MLAAARLERHDGEPEPHAPTGAGDLAVTCGEPDAWRVAYPLTEPSAAG
jgi:hypothetical protein